MTARAPGDHSTAWTLPSVSVAMPKIFPSASIELAVDDLAKNGSMRFRSTAVSAAPLYKTRDKWAVKCVYTFATKANLHRTVGT